MLTYRSRNDPPPAGRRSAAGILVAGSLALGMGVAAPAAAQETPLKIAVIDIDFVAAQSPAGQELAAEIIDLQDAYNVALAERQAVVDEIQTRIAAIDDADVEGQRVLQREYQDAVTSFQRYQQDVQAQARDRQTQGLARVREELRPVLEAVMAEDGYDLLLSATEPAVIMSSDRIDITESVLDRLRAAPSGG